MKMVQVQKTSNLYVPKNLVQKKQKMSLKKWLLKIFFVKNGAKKIWCKKLVQKTFRVKKLV